MAWFPCYGYLLQIIEPIQNRAARLITSNYRRDCSVSQIIGDFDLKPLDYHHKLVAEI